MNGDETKVRKKPIYLLLICHLSDSPTVLLIQDSFRMTSIPDIFARPHSTVGTWHISKDAETEVRYVNGAESGRTRSCTVSNARGLDDKAPSLVIDVR